MKAVAWARRLFALWILIVSAVTVVKFASIPVFHGTPGWLIAAIAAIETVAAAGFLWRPMALAMAGLLASFAAATVIHVQLGQTPWQLLLYTLITVLLYQAAQRKNHG